MISKIPELLAGRSNDMYCRYRRNKGVEQTGMKTSYNESHPINVEITNLLNTYNLKVCDEGFLLPTAQAPSVYIPYNALNALPFALSFILGGRWIPVVNIVKLLSKMQKWLPHELVKGFLFNIIRNRCIHARKLESEGYGSIEKNVLDIMKHHNPNVQAIFRVISSEKIMYIGIDCSGKPRMIAKVMRGTNRYGDGMNKIRLIANVPGFITKIYNTSFIFEDWIYGKTASFTNKFYRVKILQWLSNLRIKFSEGPWSFRDAAEYVKNAINGLSEIGIKNKKTFRHVLNAGERFLSLYQEWKGSIYAVPEHGDFVPSNIMFTNDGLVRIIDYERSIGRGCSLFDASCFLIASAAGEPKMTDPKMLLRTITGKSILSKYFKEMRREICMSNNISTLAFVNFSVIAVAKKIVMSNLERRHATERLWTDFLNALCYADYNLR